MESRDVWTFIVEHDAELRRAAARIHPSDHEDALHEAYIRVVRHAADFDEGADLTYYVYRVLRNINLDRAKSQRRHPWVSIIDWMPARGSVEDQAIARAMLPAAIERCPTACLMAIGYRDHEIAAALGKPLGTIKTRIRRERL